MESEVTKIYTAQDSIQAEMIITALSNEEIPAYKKDLGNAGLMKIYGGYSNSGEEIYVAEEDAGKALEVIEGMGLA